jgi:hypothetical protein
MTRNQRESPPKKK